MAQKLSADEIRALGFDWPRYSVIEQYCVAEDSEVDLSRTIERMRSSRSYYKRQLNEAFAFKQRSGADYSDFTDRFDDNARMDRELGVAISYLEEVIAATP